MPVTTATTKPTSKKMPPSKTNHSPSKATAQANIVKEPSNMKMETANRAKASNKASISLHLLTSPDVD